MFWPLGAESYKAEISRTFRAYVYSNETISSIILPVSYSGAFSVTEQMHMIILIRNAIIMTNVISIDVRPSSVDVVCLCCSDARMKRNAKSVLNLKGNRIELKEMERETMERKNKKKYGEDHIFYLMLNYEKN